jgi:hypothetical protein
MTALNTYCNPAQVKKLLNENRQIPLKAQVLQLPKETVMPDSIKGLGNVNEYSYAVRAT